jgi:hypothetical protein
MGVEKQGLTAEDQLFILMRAALYITATRGLERQGRERMSALRLYVGRLIVPAALFGTFSQWRYSLMTDKLSSTMQIAKRI